MASRSSSGSWSSLNSSSDSSSSSSNGEGSPQSDAKGGGDEDSESRQSSESVSSGLPSISTPSASVGGPGSGSGLAKGESKGFPHEAPFHSAVLGLIDLLHAALSEPSCAEISDPSCAKSEPADAPEELRRIPSLQSLLQLNDGDVDELMGRPRRTSGEAPAPVPRRSSAKPAHYKDSHGRVRTNFNTINFETLALGMRNDIKTETELQKSWHGIAGKLAYVLTKLDQVVPMTKGRLLNEALGDNQRRMSEDTLQGVQEVIATRADLSGLLQALSRRDPMRALKDSLQSRVGGGAGLLFALEEFAAFEKEIMVRENQVDRPEIIQMMLQRFALQQGFCVSNIAERRDLAKALVASQRNNSKRRGKRFGLKDARKKLAMPEPKLEVPVLGTEEGAAKEKEATGEEAKAPEQPQQPRDLTDLTTERGVLLEIKRAMLKLKRKCRVLEGNWVEQPRVLLTRLESQCRGLRLRYEAKISQIESARTRLSEADKRWQQTRSLKEPTLVDLEIQAYDIRVELAKSVLRWVRNGRQEQMNEWRTQMAKYHQDKVRMRGNFALAVTKWREDANFAAPGPSGVNAWKASLAFTPDAAAEGDPEDDEKLAFRRVQVSQGLTLSGITRNQLINQERLLDNTKRPLGNSWELLRRQYTTYCSFLEGQLQHWLRGDFLGPLLRRVRDLTGQFTSALVEVVRELESVKAGAKEDTKRPDLEEVRRTGGKGRPGQNPNRADARMDDALSSILMHVEKEMQFLASITSAKGDLTELLRTQQELSTLAAARPFAYDEICSSESPQPLSAAMVRKMSRGEIAPPVTFHQIQEGIEGPIRASRQLVRLLSINWTSYLQRWEVIIRKYVDCRHAYVEFLQKNEEGKRAKMLRDLKERPELFQDLLAKSQAKWRQAEEAFRREHVQPVADRYRQLADGVTDLNVELLKQKAQTASLQQDEALTFAQSLQEESNEDLLHRYQADAEQEAQRSAELDKQIMAQKELRRRTHEEQMRPKLLLVAQAAKLVHEAGDAQAKEQINLLAVDKVLDPQETKEVEGLADAALRERGYQAGLKPKPLLRLLESLLWPQASWKDQPESASPQRNPKAKRKVSIMSAHSSLQSEEPTWPRQVSASSFQSKPPILEVPPIIDPSLLPEVPAEVPSSTGQAQNESERIVSVDLPEEVLKESERIGSVDLPEEVLKESERIVSVDLPEEVQTQSERVVSADLLEEDLGLFPLHLDESMDLRGRRRLTTLNLDGSNAASLFGDNEPIATDTSLVSLGMSSSVAPVGRDVAGAAAVAPPAEEPQQSPFFPSPASEQEVLQETRVDLEPPDAGMPDDGSLIDFGVDLTEPQTEAQLDGPVSAEEGTHDGAERGETVERGEQEATASADDFPEIGERETKDPEEDTSPFKDLQTDVLQEETPASPTAEETAAEEEAAWASLGPIEDEADVNTEVHAVERTWETLVAEVPNSRAASPPRKVRIREAEEVAAPRRPAAEEEEPRDESFMMMKVFSHSQTSPSTSQPSLRPTPKRAERAKRSQSNPVLRWMQEVQSALLGSSEQEMPAATIKHGSASLRALLKQRSRLGAPSPSPLQESRSETGLAIGNSPPNVRKALGRLPCRQRPSWMKPAVMNQPAPRRAHELDPPRALITSDSGRLAHLGLPTQVNLELTHEDLRRTPSPPPGPHRTLGGGFKAPTNAVRLELRAEGLRPSSETGLAVQGGIAETLVVAGRNSAEPKTHATSGLETELWGHVRPRGSQWRVLLHPGRQKERPIRTVELDGLMSAHGVQAKSPEVRPEPAAVRPQSQTPTRPVVATTELSELLQFVKHGKGGAKQQRKPQRAQRLAPAPGMNRRTAPPSPRPAAFEALQCKRLEEKSSPLAEV